MSIRHMNYTFEELRGIVAKAIEQVPNMVNTMNKMQQIIPTDEEKTAIATEVIKLRKGIEDEHYKADEKVINDILTPIREEDNANDLWTIFNICQEKMIKGGFGLTSKNNKMRKQRSITSIKKDMDFNQRLWQMVSKYAMVA